MINLQRDVDEGFLCMRPRVHGSFWDSARSCRWVETLLCQIHNCAVKTLALTSGSTEGSSGGSKNTAASGEITVVSEPANAILTAIVSTRPSWKKSGFGLLFALRNIEVTATVASYELGRLSLDLCHFNILRAFSHTGLESDDRKGK